MTSEITEQQKLEGMESRMLIDLGMSIQDEIDIQNKRYKLIKYVLQRRMSSSEATSIYHKEIECKGKFAATTYLPDKLSGIKEHFSEEELLEMGFTPSEDKMTHIKEKWDMRKINGLKKYGGDVEDIIKEATVEGDMIDITFKRK